MVACPANGARSKQVGLQTVRSLVRKLPFGMSKTQFYFCDSPECDIVYFASESQAPVFRRADLAVRVGAKETTDPIPVCYCYGITRKDIRDETVRTGRSTVPQRIAAEVKAGNCACDVKNPSGKCCLGEVIRAVEEDAGKESISASKKKA